KMSDEVSHEVVVENLRAQGFVRVQLDGAVKHLDELMTENLDITFAKEALVIVDRLVVGPDVGGRLSDAVGTAFNEGDGDCVVLLAGEVPLSALGRVPAEGGRVPSARPLP